uniref:Uncharacterized protein n=1 Tax=Mycena chlorophos TaxID=658473 RepID=A0ABQ0M0Q1_MYCCL|nr:predicted protein [Mycena chlorophos]
MSTTSSRALHAFAGCRRILHDETGSDGQGATPFIGSGARVIIFARADSTLESSILDTRSLLHAELNRRKDPVYPDRATSSCICCVASKSSFRRRQDWFRYFNDAFSRRSAAPEPSNTPTPHIPRTQMRILPCPDRPALPARAPPSQPALRSSSSLAGNYAAASAPPGVCAHRRSHRPCQRRPISTHIHAPTPRHAATTHALRSRLHLWTIHPNTARVSLTPLLANGTPLDDEPQAGCRSVLPPRRSAVLRLLCTFAQPSWILASTVALSCTVGRTAQRLDVRRFKNGIRCHRPGCAASGSARVARGGAEPVAFDRVEPTLAESVARRAPRAFVALPSAFPGPFPLRRHIGTVVHERHGGLWCCPIGRHGLCSFHAACVSHRCLAALEARTVTADFFVSSWRCFVGLAPYLQTSLTHLVSYITSAYSIPSVSHFRCTTLLFRGSHDLYVTCIFSISLGTR